MTKHLQIDGLIPGIHTACGRYCLPGSSFETLSASGWTKDIKEVTCLECRNRYLLSAIADLLAECPPETDEEIDEDLQAFGYTPEDIERMTREVEEKIKAELKKQERNLR